MQITVLGVPPLRAKITTMQYTDFFKKEGRRRGRMKREGEGRAGEGGVMGVRGGWGCGGSSHRNILKKEKQW